jgi:hypothetical protein
MSHELYFYVNEEDRRVKKGLFGPLKGEAEDGCVSCDDLKAFLHSCGHLRYASPRFDGFDAEYLNKHTGTTILFHLRVSTIPDVESRYSFPGFNYTGLSVKIEYFRPSYFVLEASTLIEAMCQEFHMYVLDPQLSPLLKKCMAVTLVRSWEQANEKKVKEARACVRQSAQYCLQDNLGREDRPYMPRDKLMAWWKYAYRREEMTRRVRETPVKVYVPEWKVIRRVGQDKLLFAMTLAEGIGYIMPPCEVFLVKRNRFSEVGAVEAASLLPRIQEYLKPWSYSGMDFFILTSPDARRMARALRETPLESIHMYEQIAPGSFIDVDPGSFHLDGSEAGPSGPDARAPI